MLVLEYSSSDRVCIRETGNRVVKKKFHSKNYFVQQIFFFTRAYSTTHMKTTQVFELHEWSYQGVDH